ncbi:class I SAM-dependent methyltransferase [Endozoicomonas sp. Mp262]|uniref:class I SAM-dependent methyltransferase n=1 Tax=Endozoicomonas sp. Mp262 TaxID=2919499 RepID=UPI0021DA2CBC
MNKPFSQACENNKVAILSLLKKHFRTATTVLEIGSGTGQHAVYFASHLNHLTWQPSDLDANLTGIKLWINEAKLANLNLPIKLDVAENDWPDIHVDAIYSANTAHIMPWPTVKSMFRGIGKKLSPGGVFCLYGPFNYHDTYTSESNKLFDQHLKALAPEMGIRDYEAIETLAHQSGMQLLEDIAMPANNRTLVWEKN